MPIKSHLYNIFKFYIPRFFRKLLRRLTPRTIKELDERIQKCLEEIRDIRIVIYRLRCEVGLHNFSWSGNASLDVAGYNKVSNSNDKEDYKKWYFCDKCAWCGKEKPLTRIYPLLGIKEINAKTFEEYEKQK